MTSRHGQGAKQATIPGAALLLFLLPLGLAAQEEVTINRRWVGERILLTWACDRFQGTNLAVVVTDEGLVVIDTGLSPSTVRRQRALVEAELGRSDFRYLVNTHMHNDHAFANEVFPEATVVGPAHGAAALEREVALLPELLARLRSSRETFRQRSAGAAAGSEEGAYFGEGLRMFDVGIADLEAGVRPRPPTATFQTRHTLAVGDLHLEFLEFAGLHSDSDILVWIPELGVVFTGDALWGGQLPLLAPRNLDQLRQLLDHWGAVLDPTPGVKVVVPGHSDVPLSVEELRAARAYVSRLWEDVRGAWAAGTPLLRFLMGHDFGQRYPEVADWHHIRGEYNLHQHNVYVLWSLLEAARR